MPTLRSVFCGLVLILLMLLIAGVH